MDRNGVFIDGLEIIIRRIKLNISKRYTVNLIKKDKIIIVWFQNINACKRN
jgi:hypothetical protein